MQAIQKAKDEALRYLLRAPLAFVEDVPENKDDFGPEQPQSGLESPLHLPFPARRDTTSQRYLLFLFTISPAEPGARNGGQSGDDGLLKMEMVTLPPQLVEPVSPHSSEEVGV